ncbi:MAG TPA: SRPBCC family protein [Nocardioidaceae bacterium]
MRRYDVTDEAVLEATPAEVVAALADEAAGRSAWWRPWVDLRSVGEVPYPQDGSRVLMRASNTGRPDRRRSSIRLAGEVSAVEPERRILVTYRTGDFHGSSEWTFNPVDPRHTRVAYRWVAEPYGLMRLAARFVDVPAGHSDLVRKAFAGLATYIADHRPHAA